MTDVVPAGTPAAAPPPPPEPPDPPDPPVLQRQRSRPLGTVALYLLTLWAVVTVVFVLPRLIPGDPLQSLQDRSSDTYVYDPVIRAKIAAYYGLDKPLIAQYGRYLRELAHGNLGWSISQNLPVRRLLAARLPWTLLLVGGAVALAAAIGFLAGVAAAWRRGGALDRVLIITLSAVRGIPEFVLAIVMLMVFAVFIPLFPQAGAKTPFAHYPTPFDAVGDVVRHLVLPLAALTIGLAGNQFLLVRNTVISTLGEDYMVLARAKGLPRRLLKYRHAGRNALLPFLTSVGAQAGIAVGPALFVEVVFAYPGLGSLLSAGVTARDYPLLQGGFLGLAVVILAANLVLDLVYSRLDPRVSAR